MKVLIVNRSNSKSVGTISKKIGVLLHNKLDYEIYYFWGEANNDNLLPNEYCLRKKNKQLFNSDGYVAKLLRKRSGTKQLLNIVRKINPDIIHLHCIHGGYFDFGLLFKYLSKSKTRLVITAHDCWYITGGCSHFITNGCNKWKDGSKCKNCQINPLFHNLFLQKARYLPKSNLTDVVACSDFIANIYKQSFLGDKKITTIRNGVDLEVFDCITKENDMDVFRKYNVPFNSNYVLFVAAYWHESKGREYVSKLSFALENKYNVLIVGKLFNAPKGKTAYIIENINEKRDLAIFYRNALTFVNPTLEDNYPTTTLESTACGTPVVVFDVGGCSEAIHGDNGVLVPLGSFDGLLNGIDYAIKHTRKEKIRNVAELYFNDEICFEEYLNIYGKSNDK